MPANDTPIFGRAYKNPRVTLTTGFATYTGADATLLFTADATNGSRVRRLLVTQRGTNVASVLRVFKAVGAANYALIRELHLPASTASSTVAVGTYDVSLDLGLEPSAQIYVQLSTTVAGGVDVMAEAMDY